MALTVSTAPAYSGTLTVGSGNSTPGNLQGTSSPQNTINGNQLQGGGVQAAPGAVLGATTGGNGFVAPPVDYAAITARNNASRDAGLAFDAATSGANQSVADDTLKYRNDAADFASGIKTGQDTINTGRANNQLNLRRTMSGIAAGIRTGVRSGGVSLANMNALDSGAAEAMARAYAQNGNSQAADANNQSQLKENEFDTSQGNLDTQQATGMARLQSWRANETNRVSAKLFSDLKAADTIATAGGAGGVDMGARDRIIASAAQQLDQIDAITHGTLGQVHGFSPDQARAKAMEMDQAGATATAPFAVETGGMSVNAPDGAALGQFGLGPQYRKDQNNGLV